MQRWKISDRAGDRKFLFRAKTCSPQSLHNFIQVVTVCGIDFADEAMPPVLSAEINLKGAVGLRMQAQQLYSNFPRDAPRPLGGGKQANFIDQLSVIHSCDF